MPRRFPDDEGFDKVNFIIDSWTTGCDAPWYIYIETMKPAALRAFLVLLSFGWADILRGALRPKGLGRRSQKRKGKWARRIPAFPELGNTIGKQLPFGEQIDDFIKWSDGTRTLWRIDTAMQAGLFWWLVADVAEDFVFNWTSLLYESYWCQPDPPGRFSYSRSGNGTIWPGHWKLIAYPTEDYEYGPPAWGFQSGTTGPNPAQITAAVSIVPFGQMPAPTGVRLRIINMTTFEVYGETGPVEPDDQGEVHLPVSGTVPANSSFEVRAWIESPEWAYYAAGVVLGVEIKP